MDVASRTTKQQNNKQPDNDNDNDNDNTITITSLKELVVVSTININIYSKERKNKIKMPWQSAGAMTVIIAMFNVVPLLVGGIQYLGHGVSTVT